MGSKPGIASFDTTNSDRLLRTLRRPYLRTLYSEIVETLNAFSRALNISCKAEVSKINGMRCNAATC